MCKWFSFRQISGKGFVRFPTQQWHWWRFDDPWCFSQHFWSEAQQKSGSANPVSSGKGVVLWSFLQLRQSIGAVMTNKKNKYKNIPSNAASASLECTRGFLRIRSVNVRLCWTEALGFAKINKFCAAMAMETRRVSIYVTAAGWIEVSVDEHFTAGTFEAFIVFSCFFTDIAADLP